MRNLTYSFASVISDNTLSLSFPYEGAQAKLTLQTSNPKDLVVFVSISTGQFHCIGYATIRIKFDNGPIEELRCIVPRESDHRTMYFEDDWSFYAKLRKAKTLILPRRAAADDLLRRRTAVVLRVNGSRETEDCPIMSAGTL